MSEVLVDEITTMFQELYDAGYCVGVDEDNERFVVLDSERGELTYSIPFDREKRMFTWEKIEEDDDE